jgi:hypothetical protein
VVDDLLLVLLVDEVKAALVACPSPPWSVLGLPALLLLGQVLACLLFSSLVRFWLACLLLRGQMLELQASITMVGSVGIFG